MSEMVERVAKAIGCRDYERCPLPQQEHPEQCDDCLATARLAIGAMREPTRAMAEAGATRWHKGDWKTPGMMYLGDAHALVWERAIDAALDL